MNYLILLGLLFASINPILAKPISKRDVLTPFYLANFSSYQSSIVKRVYCSAKSIGFDIHFNSQTGDLYSFDDFSEQLVPYDIRLEIPFYEIIPADEYKSFISQFEENIDGPFTSISDNKLLIKISEPSDPNQFIALSLDLYDLQLRFKVSDDDTQTQRDILLFLSQAEREIKCEYIKPESTRIKLLKNRSFPNYRPRY